MDNHQTLTDSLLGPQDGDTAGSQIPGPVTAQPAEMACTAQRSDSFPCLKPLSLPQKAQGDAQRPGEVMVAIKEKTENGNGSESSGNLCLIV